MRHGFSLVELSIVLVILGLLTGGILAGQSLIHAAELRSVSTDFSRYSAALYTFRDKYFGLPGDITNATKIWGAADAGDGLGADCGDAISTTATTCNGNGNGQLSNVPAEFVRETFRAWQQMANAGLIEGQFVGAADAGPDASIGRQFPRAKLNPGGYELNYLAVFYRTGGNFLKIASKAAGASTGLNGGLMAAEDGWNIDTKLDDGLSDGGKLVALDRDVAGCVTNGTTYTATTTGSYMLGGSAKACALYYFFGL